MSDVHDIERAVERLSEAQLSEFRRWFLAFDAGAWDRQIEADAASGKLDTLAEEARSEYHSGKAQEF